MSTKISGSVTTTYLFDNTQLIERFGPLSDEGLQQICNTLAANVDEDFSEGETIPLDESGFNDSFYEMMSDFDDEIESGKLK